MSNLKHMIHRQLFELTAKTGQPAWEWDRTTADFHRDLLLPVLEACFREADHSGEHLIIDRLEIDLGIFGGREAFRKEAGDRLRERLVAGLQVKRREASESVNLTSTGKTYHPTSSGPASQQNQATAENPAANNPRRETPPAMMDEKEAPLAAFLFFLKEGRLPWWFAATGNDVFGKPFQDGLTGVFIRKIIAVLDEAKPLGTGASIPGIIPEIAECIRCVQLLNDAVLIRMAVEKRWNMSELQREWEMLRTSATAFPGFYPAFRQRYWTTILQLESAGEVSQKKWEYIFPVKDTPEQLIAGLMGKTWGSKRPSLQYFVESKMRQLQSGTAPSTSTSIKGENSTLPEITPKPRQSPSPKKITDPKNITPESEGLYVDAAGLVLLHPFLQELFASTGCREGKDWTLHGRQTAVRLLGYLSDGDADLPEYRLVFQKILAGMAPEEPLEAIPPATTAMLDACNELLDAVLSHWTALKNTGRDGLREGFLQRSGILRTGPDGMQLEMEKRAQDVLINRLPWSCSMVRLSWMEQLVAVNWI